MTTRVVVVGSGIAGLTAAIHAHERGCDVTVMTKSAADEANTRYAQGGIAAVASPDGAVPDDSPAVHAADTLVAGAHLGDERAVRLLAASAPALVAELISAGVVFDRDARGTFHRGLEAAHSRPRVLHAGGDATGAAIQAALVAAVRTRGIRILEHTMLVDLRRHRGRVTGVDLLRDGARATLEADAVILATGGAGQLYSQTTNPPVATGDGIAVAIRSGAAVADLEFIQFHPTVLAVGAPFLVSEAVRGEGAILVDGDGDRFLTAVHPDAELAPRDVVARAIDSRMAAQGGPVLLDATALGAAFLAERFPTIDAAVRERGLDWSTTAIPVTPAAHYVMGGVVTDLDGRTTAPGLYAVGEVARTGVHGANRLASNSLLEGAVFGARAGDAVAADAGRAWRSPAASAPASLPHRAAGAMRFTRAALQDLMWRSAGLGRDEAGLGHAAAQLAAWRVSLGRPVTASDVEDANLLLLAAHVVTAALRRRDSVGAHFRTDSPAVSMPPPASAYLGAA